MNKKNIYDTLQAIYTLIISFSEFALISYTIFFIIFGYSEIVSVYLKNNGLRFAFPILSILLFFSMLIPFQINKKSWEYHYDFFSEHSLKHLTVNTIFTYFNIILLCLLRLFIIIWYLGYVIFPIFKNRSHYLNIEDQLVYGISIFTLYFFIHIKLDEQKISFTDLIKSIVIKCFENFDISKGTKILLYASYKFILSCCIIYLYKIYGNGKYLYFYDGSYAEKKEIFPGGQLNSSNGYINIFYYVLLIVCILTLINIFYRLIIAKKQGELSLKYYKEMYEYYKGQMTTEINWLLLFSHNTINLMYNIQCINLNLFFYQEEYKKQIFAFENLSKLISEKDISEQSYKQLIMICKEMKAIYENNKVELNNFSQQCTISNNLLNRCTEIFNASFKRQNIEMEEIHINSFIKTFINEYPLTTKITFNYHEDPKDGVFISNEKYLKIALKELFDNCEKFSLPDSEVQLEVINAKKNDNILLLIRNDIDTNQERLATLQFSNMEDFLFNGILTKIDDIHYGLLIIFSILEKLSGQATFRVGDGTFISLLKFPRCIKSSDIYKSIPKNKDQRIMERYQLILRCLLYIFGCITFLILIILFYFILI